MTHQTGNKTEQITIRVSEDFKAKITDAALKESRTVADYIRMAIKRDIERSK